MYEDVQARAVAGSGTAGMREGVAWERMTCQREEAVIHHSQGFITVWLCSFTTDGQSTQETRVYSLPLTAQPESQLDLNVTI